MSDDERFRFEIADRAVLEYRARHLYANIVWTHKIHEKQADIYSAERKGVDRWGMVCTALAGCGIFASTFIDAKLLNILSCVVSAFAIYFELKSHMACYEDLIAGQIASARKFLALRDEMLDLLAALHFEGASPKTVADALFRMEASYAEACDGAPRTTRKAVRNASAALGKGEETYTEDEIDSLLPEYLRRGK